MDLYLLKLKVVGLSRVFIFNKGFVIAATSTLTARQIAAENAKAEGPCVWFLPDITSCEAIGEANANQKAGIVLRDTNAR